MLPVVMVGIVTVLCVLGDCCMKVAGSKTPVSRGWFALGTLIYLVTVPGWFMVLKRWPLYFVGSIYAACSIVLLTGIGIYWFRERLTTQEWIGLACILAGLALLKRY